jgi:putative phosphoesterase
MTRLAIFSDVHGNLLALEAVQKAIRAAAPDVVMIAGDLVFNGPRPVETLDLVRELEREGALVIQGNTDIAVADFDFTAAFPWFTEGAPESFRIAAQWAHDALGAERLDYLRRLPAERRLRVGDDLVLLCHASPGSQTAGLDPTLDPTVVVERVTRTDARLICCGHTHLPDVRDLGWKVVVNDGSAGYVFDGNPTASWALVDLGPGGTIAAEIKRAEFDVMAVANELTARGLPGDVYRAATVRTGKLVR